MIEEIKLLGNNHLISLGDFIARIINKNCKEIKISEENKVFLMKNFV